jgi:hypothetical protein
MEAMLNPQNDDSAQFSQGQEKSELMQVFEAQVKDMYWAYKDLLKEIFSDEKDLGQA